MSAWNLACVMVVAVLVLTPTPVSAQRRGGRNAQTESLAGEATIKGVRPGVLQITTAEGQDWLVTIPTQLENVVFRGAATTQFLQPQMALRFPATFPKTDKRKKEYQTSKPLESLEIITIRPGSEPNVYPDEQANGRRELFQGDDAERPDNPDAAKKKEGGAEGETLACLVIGTLVEFKSGKLKVAAGPYTVVADVSETATIAVDVRHCLWVQPGDRVELNARYNPYLRGQAEGQQLTITAAKTLTLPEKASKGRRRGSRDRKSDGEKPQDG